MKNTFILLITFFTLISCSKKEVENPKAVQIEENNPVIIIEKEIVIDTVVIDANFIEPTIKKGLFGFVIEWKGDFMPGSTPTGTIDSVQRDIYIYEKLTFDSIKNARTEPYSWFWYVDSIKQKPLKIIKTNNRGFYQVELDSGNYSAFAKYNHNTFYSNGGTSDGQLGQVEYKNSTLIQRNFDIDFEKRE